jgi:hypothetical protein
MRRLPVLALCALLAAFGSACGTLGLGGDDSEGGGRQDYPTEFSDGTLDLEAMALRDADMPERGLQRLVGDTFTNEEWSRAFESQVPLVDAAQKQIQLDAQGRVLGYLALFTWDAPIEHLGRTQQIESHSVIYVDEEAASNAMRFHACGLLIGDDQQLDQFEVPRLATESTGFFFETTVDPLGKFVDTVVCFRTGRVLHAVVANGLDGTQDSAINIALARKMLGYVEATLDGDEVEPDGEEG